MNSLFDTGWNLRRAGIAITAGASLFALAGAAHAVPQVRITSVGASWSVTGGTGVVYTPEQPQGQQDAEVRWGTPHRDQGGTPETRQKSGYLFEGVAPPTTDWYDAGVDQAGANFNLGDFTHFNWAINVDSGISGAVLNLTFGFDWRADNNPGSVLNSDTFSAQYVFNHWETPNGNNPCANGEAHGSGVNANGCADRVIATLNQGQQKAFEDAAGNLYFLSISGFQTANGLVSQFWTTENMNNKATLVANFTTEPNVIPLPAAAWLLIGGLGALGAVARRRTNAGA